MRKGFDIERRDTRIMTGLLVLCLFTLTTCGKDELFGPRPAGGKANQLDIPLSINPRASALALDYSEGLNLQPNVAATPNITVSGCTNVSTFGPTTIRSGGTIRLYTGDTNCIVKLNSFVLGSTKYCASSSATGCSSATGATNFSTWLAGDVATFQNSNGSTTDKIKVYVQSQVTQGGVLSSDNVVYNFTDINAATSDALSAVTVQTPVGLTVNGNPSPNFTVTQARILSTNTNGTDNMSFTLQCGASMTGSSLSTYACSGNVLQTQFDYIFISDAYSQGSITVAQANAAFNANTPTTIGNLIVAPGGTDLNSNTLANGGFYTSTSTPLVTGSSISTQPNNVLMIRLKDLSGNTQSYLYMYVNLTLGSATVAACGGYFAGGAGTSGNPYQVNDLQTFANTALCTTSTTYFIQTANINLNGSSSNPWAPFVLYGQYNGNGYTISNLYLNDSAGTVVGLFTTINSSASVSNLTLSSVTVALSNNNESEIGALAGQSEGTITNCSASGTITGVDSIAGGLIGYMDGGSITNSSSSVALTINLISGIGFDYRAGGGLVGSIASPASISNSYATGAVNASGTLSSTVPYYGGGLVGTSGNVTISNSYSTGNQTVSVGDANLGSGTYMGMIGLNSSTTVTGCFATGTYSFTSTDTGNNPAISLGGISGDVTSTTISNSYSMVTLSSSGPVKSSFAFAGGFIGTEHGSSTVTHSYSASPSMASISFSNSEGFIGDGGGLTTVTGSYLYNNGNVVNQTLTGLTSLNSTQIHTQGSFTNFTFGTSSTNNWSMPTANPLSPGAVLSPVQLWQCGIKGITCTSTCVASFFASGSGTSGSPYSITNAQQLAATSNCTTSTTYFQQANNINLGGSTFPQWVPITFSGQYNGANQFISNLYINSTTATSNIGLFNTMAAGAGVSNLILSSVNITYSTSQGGSIGALVGTDTNGNLTNCSSSGSISVTVGQNTSVGGLVANISGGTVSNSSSSVSISTSVSGGVNATVGGLVGTANNSVANITISNSYATGNLSGNVGSPASIGSGALVGFLQPGGGLQNSYSTGNQTYTASSGSLLEIGMVGVSASGATISGSYATGTYSFTSGTVTTFYMGGIVGTEGNGSITNSYSMVSLSSSGTVTTGYVGGFIGNESNVTISNSYSADPVVSGSGLTAIHGFVGINSSGTFTNDYLYTIGGTITDSQSGVTSLSSAGAMQTQSNFTGFTFGTSTQNWQMPNSNSIASPTSLLSPVLQWQCTGSGGVSTAACP